MNDPASLGRWLDQQSKALSQAQSTWYDATEGPGWNPAYAATNGLLTPRNAALVSAYLRSRDPETLEQLRKNMLVTPGRAALVKEQDRRLANDPMTQWLGQETGEDYAAPMKDAPITLATMLTAGAGGAASAESLMAGESLGAASLQAAKGLATGVALGNLQMDLEDPHATPQQRLDATKDMIATSLGMAATGHLLQRGAKAVVSGANLLPLPKTWTRDEHGTPIPKEIRSASGITIQADPTRTTTILGVYDNHMLGVLEHSLDAAESMRFGSKKGGYNVLNILQNRYDEKTFWEKYNRPWLDKAIERGDKISLATPPTEDFFFQKDKQGNFKLDDLGNRIPTGFKKEYDHLTARGYQYDSASHTMIPEPPPK